MHFRASRALRGRFDRQFCEPRVGGVEVRARLPEVCVEQVEPARTVRHGREYRKRLLRHTLINLCLQRAVESLRYDDVLAGDFHDVSFSRLNSCGHVHQQFAAIAVQPVDTLVLDNGESVVRL